ncbi:MAG: molybdopterin-guanine dinucleotide biosynthesis protein B [Thermodesulfobacterium sp.]|jgi:molybdopterin-guanine dinucleotide biosynthesis protein B|nr:molybdopterin-guanine dinucleotide biosynthesis protein B [Thermodesulfobacterium sp.]
MPKFLALSGYHNSGKTTVGTYIVAKLSEKGYKVGVIKSTKETTEETDKPGSDTFKYRKAGAKQVVLFQRDRMTLFIEDIPKDKDEVFTLFERLFFDYDLVILEGFKEWRDVPKIWLKRNDEEGLPEGIENIQMVAEAKDKERILSFVEDYLGVQNNGDIKIFVNDKDIPLKPHLKLLCQNIMLGILASLKGVPKIEEVKTIEVLIKR